MKDDCNEILDLITLYSARPPLFEPGEKLFWNDLSGTPYKAGGDWLAVAAGKR